MLRGDRSLSVISGRDGSAFESGDLFSGYNELGVASRLPFDDPKFSRRRAKMKQHRRTQKIRSQGWLI